MNPQAEATVEAAPESLPQSGLCPEASQGEDSCLPRVQPPVRSQGQPDPAPGHTRPGVWPQGARTRVEDWPPKENQIH